MILGVRQTPSQSTSMFLKPGWFVICAGALGAIFYISSNPLNVVKRFKRSFVRQLYVKLISDSILVAVCKATRVLLLVGRSAGLRTGLPWCRPSQDCIRFRVLFYAAHVPGFFLALHSNRKQARDGNPVAPRSPVALAGTD